MIKSLILTKNKYIKISLHIPKYTIMIFKINKEIHGTIYLNKQNNINTINSWMF